MSTTCPRCGVELVRCTHCSSGPSYERDNGGMGPREHTPDRCADRLAARVAELERERNNAVVDAAAQTSNASALEELNAALSEQVKVAREALERIGAMPKSLTCNCTNVAIERAKAALAALGETEKKT